MEIEALELAQTHARPAPRYAAAASLARILCRFRLWRERPVPSDRNHALYRESRLRGGLGLDSDVVLQSFERAQNLRKGCDFHERANRELTRRIKSLRWILAAKSVQNSNFSRDDEFIRV